MKFILPILLVITGMLIYSCANQIPPTGGAKDTIPPTLLSSQPHHKSINYKGQEFRLQFDERINADKIKQNLIITPFTENNYTFKTKKNELTITFENAFDSLTTYTLNFADGVTDITEKTPAVNLSLAFSTGPIIDSIFVAGKTIDLYNNEPLQKILIAIFDANDTLDILTGKPKYFAKTNEEGEFRIENIKNGFYKIYAFEDDNNNMINEPEEEIHAFLSDSIDLNNSMDSILLRLQLLDTRPLKFNRGKYTGIYYDLTYNKYIQNYTIQQIHNPKKLSLPKYNLIDDNTTIRFYYNNQFQYEKDSIGLILTANDSLNNVTQDTVFLKFRSSKRKPTPFSYQLTPKNNTKIDNELHINLQFDKPIIIHKLDSIQFQYDTLFFLPIPDSIMQWNDNFTQLSFTTELDPNFLKLKLDSLKPLYLDTTQTDTTKMIAYNYLNKIDTLKVSLTIPPNAFISVEYDSTKKFHNTYSFKKPDDYGMISGTVTTLKTSYTLQLVKENYDVIAQLRNVTNYSFRNVPPGKYTFRVLIDSNTNGKWDYGNMQQKREPEPIFFYPEVFDVRANWQLDNIDIEF
ncbi:MAG: Ig-like domain-containing protein [Reichenbachiella sp.]